MRTWSILGVLLGGCLLGCGGAAPRSSQEPTPAVASGDEQPGIAPTPPPRGPLPAPIAPEPVTPLPSATPSSVGAGLETTPGKDSEHPVQVCGARASYQYIASVACRDGTVPLRNDPGAGARARVGNTGANSTGHIIDLYEVPCPGGALRIYVDMYGCP